MYSLKKLHVLAVAAAMTGALAACASDTGTGSGFGESAQNGKGSVVLLEQPWVDLQVENQIAKQLLEKIGYKVSNKNVSVELGVKGLETGDMDAYLGNWWPSQKISFGKSIDAGKINVLGTLLTGTEFSPAVPKQTAEKLDISSLADLDKNAGKFGKQIYGIEPGTPGNQTVQKMIDEDAYGLGDWKLVESGTPAMLTQVKRAVKKDQPIVFLAWTPHWMAIEFGTVFLNDPKKVWDGAGEIRAVTRAGYAKKEPEITKFLSNLEFTPDEAGQFYFDRDKKGKSLQQIASAWVKDNPDKVKEFLEEVKSADGEPAETKISG